MSTSQSNPVTSTGSTSSSAFRARTDIAWNHVQEIAKNKYKCCYCEKVFSGGGIHRMKKHLAKIQGDVAPCKKVPPHVQLEIKTDLENITNEKGKKKHSIPERRPFPSLDLVEEDVEMVSTEPNSNQKDALAPFKKVKVASGGVQPSIRCAMAGKDAIERVYLEMGKWFSYACIPFNAVNSPYFKSMLNAMLPIGMGFPPPSYYQLSEKILKKNVEELKGVVESMKEKWKVFGCTIMADGWTDQRGRTLINFLVYSARQSVFLKSVDASEYVKTGELLAGLFMEIIDEVGPNNVVQIITDNASNYKLAGYILSEKYPFIVWTPCVAHCINLMFEDIAKMDEIKVAIEKS